MLFTKLNRKRPFYKALADAFPKAKVKTAEDRKVANTKRMIKCPGGAEVWFGEDLDNPLAEHVRRLANFIRKANELPPLNI